MSKSTAEEFIIKARVIHGDKYLYDAVSYIKSSIKVKITCRKHGLFEQTPNSHLNGAGCPSCSGNKKKTTREFVADAIAIEKYYHKKYGSAGLTGFDGATEWLKYSPELMDEIMNKAP